MFYSISIRTSVFCLLFLMAVVCVPAAPGDLDPSFGSGGKVFTSIGKRDFYGSAVAVQADGKFVTAGSSKGVSSLDFALARFNADGSFDQTFDGDGRVTTDFGGSDGTGSIAIQSDGKIVAFGNSDNRFAVARYNSDGSLDATFDGDGKVITAPDGNYYQAVAVALQTDGKIVVAGRRSENSSVDFVLARYNSNGALDATFSGDGLVFTDFNNSYDYATSVAIQADGKIVTAGGSDGRFALTRHNADGLLDTTFDGDGKVTTDFGGSNETVWAIAIQSDGKIVAAGSTNNTVFALARYNSDGSLDTTFDGDGKLTTDFGSTRNYASAVAIQADGKIVAAGSTSQLNNNIVFALARYNSDGSLDTTFDGDGKVITALNGGISDIALRTDGRIIAVGGDYFTNLASYNSNGTLDTTFDGDGKLTIPTGESYDRARDVAIQADGKIVTAGSSTDDRYVRGRFVLTRHNADGSLDTTFDGDGIMTTTISGYVNAVAIQSDGKIVTAGYAYTGGQYLFFLARFNPDGSPDTTFDGDGQAATAFAGYSGAGASDLAIQADGKIVAAGSAGNSQSNQSNSVFALARFNNDGSLDTTFDGDGKVTTAFDSSARAYAIAIQSDGKIVAAGDGGDGYYSGFALARYNADGALDTSFDGDGKVTTSFGNNYELASAVAIQADGKIVAIGVSYECGDFCYPTNRVLVSRYNSDGSLDTSFSGDGKVTDNFGSEASATAVAIKSNGRIVVAGTVSNSDYDFFLAQDQSNSKAVFDFDGDGKSDISVFRPSDGTWYINQSTNGFTGIQFGFGTDKLVPADYDGDGKTDIAVFRNGFWYWLNSSNNQFNAVQFGQAGDIPVPADYDGDGRAELAVFRSGFWHTLNLAANQFQSTQFGIASDKPVAADYDGDGKSDIAVVRQSGGLSIWYILGSSRGFYGFQFGTVTDKLVPADYDGDGKTDFAVFRPSDGNWYVWRSLTNSLQTVSWGLASDVFVPADYDGDGKADIAVYRNGTWYIRQTSSGINYSYFGSGGDVPTNQIQ